MDNSSNNNMFGPLMDSILNASDAVVESPIEDLFESKLLGFLAHDTVTFKRQHEVNTDWGKFRLDFALFHKDFKLGIECDGKDFHDAEFDLWRDALLLNGAEVDKIIRISGAQIYRNIYSCIYRIMILHPFLFQTKERPRIISRAIDEIRSQLFDKLHYLGLRHDASPYEKKDIIHQINALSERDIEFSGYVTQRDLSDAEVNKIILYAEKNRGIPVSDLIRQYTREQGN
jgi:hypothetical protein